MTTAEGLPPAPSYGSTPQYPIESVDKALQVLLLLGEQPKLRLTDVSRYLGVASSTAHRVLAMLQYRGFVRQDTATRSYVPGPTLDGLAFGVLRRLDVRTRARPVLERLNTDLGETVHLGRLEGNNVHFIDSLESSRALRVGGRLGRSMPAHCTSTGKALLAELSEEEIFRLYPDEELEAVTERTISTRTALERELELTRRRGYASSMQESEEGVASVAVPVTSPGGVSYAINISMPTTRMSSAARARLAERLAEASKELTALLV